jgi:hypothetical protein
MIERRAIEMGWQLLDRHERRGAFVINVAARARRGSWDQQRQRPLPSERPPGQVPHKAWKLHRRQRQVALRLYPDLQGNHQKSRDQKKRFLERKMAEYQALRDDIEKLQREIDLDAEVESRTDVAR